MFSVGGSGELGSTYHDIVPLNSAIEQAISTARLATYRRVTADDTAAWALYRWNTELAAAWLPLMADTEVALRNAIHHRLSAHFGRADWWAHERLALDDQTAETLATVVRDHQMKIARAPSAPARSSPT